MVVFCHNFYAQNYLLFEAQKLCNEKKYDIAIPMLEKIIVHPDTKNDPASWHIRSYAYLQLYKQAGTGNTSNISSLDTAMLSALISIKLDTAKGYLENNHAFVKNGAATYYKISTILLQDSLNTTKSELFFSNYKKYTTIVNPSFDFKQKDIEFFMYLR